MDLVVLVADKDARFALQGILTARQRLGIRRIEANLLAAAYHDSYAFRRCHDLLRLEQGRARHALVMFDREGCGSLSPRVDLESRLRRAWHKTGGQDAQRPSSSILSWKPGSGAIHHRSMRRLAGRSGACG